MSTKALILAGGSGTRFWPKSTKDKPKQFLRITSDRTMIQETVSLVWKADRKLPGVSVFHVHINEIFIVNSWGSFMSEKELREKILSLTKEYASIVNSNRVSNVLES